jgi:hypothetical protein
MNAKSTLIALTLVAAAFIATPAKAEVIWSSESMFIVTGSDMNRLRQTNAFCTEIQKDTGGNEVVRKYREVARVDGRTADSRTGEPTSMLVTLKPERTFELRPVTDYHIWYADPRTGQWVRYTTTTDVTAGNSLLKTLHDQYGLNVTFTSSPGQSVWVETTRGAYNPNVGPTVTPPVSTPPTGRTTGTGVPSGSDSNSPWDGLERR